MLDETVLLRHHLTEGDIIKLGQERLDSDRKAIHKFGVGISIAWTIVHAYDRYEYGDGETYLYIVCVHSYFSL